VSLNMCSDYLSGEGMKKLRLEPYARITKSMMPYRAQNGIQFRLAIGTNASPGTRFGLSLLFSTFSFV
jgi:hypothetical protein